MIVVEQDSPQRPQLQVSVTSVTTGVVASVSSALLGSTLGVAGTLVGAAVGAVVYSLAAAFYQHSLATTKYRLESRRHALGSLDGELTTEEPGETGNDVIPAAAHSDTVTRTRQRAERPVYQWKAVLAGSIGSALAFGLALLLVTGIESAKGSPMAGGVHGGLTVLGGAPAAQPDPISPRGQTTSVVDVRTSTATAVSTHTVRATETVTSEVPAPGASDAGGTTAAETAPPSATTDPDATAPTSGPAATATSQSAPGGSPGADPAGETSGAASPSDDPESLGTTLPRDATDNRTADGGSATSNQTRATGVDGATADGSGNGIGDFDAVVKPHADDN